jgi:gamma-tubulin complex component 2
MQTCTFFASYYSWMTKTLEDADPDLSGKTRPKNMSEKNWKAFQEYKAAREKMYPGSSQPSPQGEGQDPEARFQNLFDIMKRWEDNFSRHLQILLDALNHYAATETVVLLSLCARLSTANQGTNFAGPRQEEDLDG